METKLTGIPETMLIPLWARAAETRRAEPMIRDEKAVEMMGQIDYDFWKFEKAWKTQTGIAIRTLLLDDATRRFVEQHPVSVILNLGAGLDTRFSRVDNGQILWYDFDLPEVIEIRKHFFTNTERYRMIPGSVLDDEWINEFNVRDRPVLIIAEGILMYFDERDVRNLIDKIVAGFPGAEMLLDTITPAMTGRAKYHDTVSKTRAEFKWGIKAGRELETYNDRVSLAAEWNYFDYGQGRWGWMGWLAKIPPLRKQMNNSIVHLRFGSRDARPATAGLAGA